jgi:rubrerythrin
MNPIFKVILDILHIQSDREKQERARRDRAEAGGEPRRCPSCGAAAGEHDTECPSCGARLD